MKFKVSKNQTQKLSQKVNLMVCLVFFLGVSNLMLGGLAWYTTLHQKTYITPFFGGNGFEISDTKVDGNYMNLMSENFIYSMLNITPKTVSHQHELVMKYVSSSVYSQFKENLVKENKLVKEKEISSHIEITHIKSQPEDLTSVISGELSRMVGTRNLKQEKVQYLMRFDYVLGKLTIKEFKKIEGLSHD